MDALEKYKRGSYFPDNFTIPVRTETKKLLHEIRESHQFNVTSWARDLIEKSLPQLMQQLRDNS